MSNNTLYEKEVRKLNNVEVFSKLYCKLNPENQSSAQNILQTLKYVQDAQIKQKTGRFSVEK